MTPDTLLVTNLCMGGELWGLFLPSGTSIGGLGAVTGGLGAVTGGLGDTIGGFVWLPLGAGPEGPLCCLGSV